MAVIVMHVVNACRCIWTMQLAMMRFSHSNFTTIGFRVLQWHTANDLLAIVLQPQFWREYCRRGHPPMLYKTFIRTEHWGRKNVSYGDWERKFMLLSSEIAGHIYANLLKSPLVITPLHLQHNTTFSIWHNFFILPFQSGRDFYRLFRD